MIASICSGCNRPAITASRRTAGPVATPRAAVISRRAVPSVYRYRPRSHTANDVAPSCSATSAASTRRIRRSFNPASVRSAATTASSTSTHPAGVSGHSGTAAQASTASAITATRWSIPETLEHPYDILLTRSGPSPKKS